MEEEKEVDIVKEKEKKEIKKSKSWGRRSTRAKKCISYRYNIIINIYNHFSYFLILNIYNIIVIAVSGLMNLMKQSKRQLRKTSKKLREEVHKHFLCARFCFFALCMHFAQV